MFPPKFQENAVLDCKVRAFRNPFILIVAKRRRVFTPYHDVMVQYSMHSFGDESAVFQQENACSVQKTATAYLTDLSYATPDQFLFVWHIQFPGLKP
tara:strand:- start:253 stop:543 length:291 start_codon:yes stop_codon:yes gene_type:complete